MSTVEKVYLLRISGVLDRSTSAAVGDLVQQYDRAGRASSRRLTETQRLAERVARDQERAERNATARAEREANTRARAEERAKTRSADIAKRLIDRAYKDEQGQAERAQAYVARIKDRYFAEQQRKEEAAERRAESERRSRIKNIGADAIGTMAAVGRKALGVYGGLARSAGVNLDLGSALGKAVSNESLAVRVAGYGYVEGEKGAAGARQSPKDILAEAHAAANASALEGGTGSVLAGLSEFVKRSSDLETGRKILGDMAKYAKATGSDFGDVARAAGDVAKKLGDVPDKAEKIKAVMGVFGRQGKLGAIDMSDLAPQIATMIGPSNKFAGGTMAAMTQLGVAMQITKSFGGVKGPAQAATSVANFANYLTSAAGQKNLVAGGLKDTDIFADKGHKQLRSVEDIVIKALQATGGDLTKMSKMFRNVRAGAVLQGFSQVYSEAEGQKKGSGAAAIKDVFQSYGSSLSEKDINEQLGRELGTSESKIQLFNNRVEQIGENLAGKLLPSLDRLAPTVERGVEAFAKVVEFGAAHPEAAITTAIVGSIAKAAIGEAVKGSLTKMLGQVGSVGGGLSIGVASIAIAAGSIAVQKIGEGADKAHGQVGVNEDILSKAEKEFRETNKLSPETRQRLADLGDRLKKEKQLGNEAVVNESGTTLGGISAGVRRVGRWVSSDQSMADIGEAAGYREHMGNITNQEKGVAALIRAADAMEKASEKPKGPIDVNIVGGSVTVSDSAGNGREGVGDTH